MEQAIRDIKCEEGRRHPLQVIFQPSRQAQRHEPALPPGHGRRADDCETDRRDAGSGGTGAGEALSAADLTRYFRPNRPEMRHKGAPRPQSMALAELFQPFPCRLAMGNGFMLGGGFKQGCDCDFAIAADRRVFGLSEVTLGHPAGACVMERTPAP